MVARGASVIVNLLRQRVPERKVKIKNISFINKISLSIIESHFALTPNWNLKPDNFYLLLFSSFVWNGAHQWF